MSKSETDVVNAAFYRVRLRRRRGIADKGVDAEPRRPGEMLGWGLWKNKNSHLLPNPTAAHLHAA